jgi:hypothetical protein
MRLRVLLIITIFLFSVSCKKKQAPQDVSVHPVPSVALDITVYPNDPLNFTIQAIGGWKYINGGINGIILYRKSQQEFVALERTSAQLPDDPGAKVKVLSDNFTCRDTVSGSEWQIFDGTVTKGPAAWPLRLYSTNYDGNTLRIRN